eukprot:scaffold12490_cov66-Phaeocystis_antarctica.AAC.5
MSPQCHLLINGTPQTCVHSALGRTAGSANLIALRHTGHVFCFLSTIQRRKPSAPHQCMHGSMLNHLLVPISA